MSPKSALRSYLIFTASGPILVLSTFPKLTDDRLIAMLRYKGIERFIAYQVDLDALAECYPDTFSPLSEELAGTQDARVLDANGHQIMARISLDELGDPIKFGG